jgi:hypothetical protein
VLDPQPTITPPSYSAPTPPAYSAPIARRRRPIFGWIALALVVAAYVTVGAAAIYADQQTLDAFIQLPPWWALTSSIAGLPVAILAGLGLLLGIVGTARREKPGWPTITAMILSLPALGYVAISVYIWLTVTAACAGPAGVCS